MGTLAREGLHPDQAPEMPVGVWCDAAWSAWTDLLLRIDGQERVDALQQMWDEINTPLDKPEPTMADWGTSDAAQAGAAALMAMMGGQMPGPAGDGQ